MSLYANIQFLVSVVRVEEDGELLTPEIGIPAPKGSYIATDELGMQYVITEEHFNSNYVEVEKVRPKPPKRRISPFEAEYTKQLVEFGSLDSNIESEEYIVKQMEYTKNKAF